MSLGKLDGSSYRVDAIRDLAGLILRERKLVKNKGHKPLVIGDLQKGESIFEGDDCCLGLTGTPKKYSLQTPKHGPLKGGRLDKPFNLKY